MIREKDGIEHGPVKTYTHEKFYIKDSQGRICRLRCSFDKDKFILRSAMLVELSNAVPEGVGITDNKANFGKYIPIKDIIVVDKEAEFHDGT